MKKLGLLVIGLIAMVLLPLNINAAKKEPITVHIFRGEGCGYCKAALAFFDSIEDEYGDYFDLETHEVWYDEDNANWMQAVAEHFNEDVGGVPYIIIGEKTFKGYSETYDDEIIKTIKSYYDKGNFEDQVIKVKGNAVTSKTTGDDNKKSSDSKEENSSSEKTSTKTTVIIITVAIVGFIALIYFARDNSDEVEEVKAKKVVVEEVKEEPKKVEPKKTTTTKKTTPKKTTTKKAPAKKTTKKTTKK